VTTNPVLAIAALNNRALPDTDRVLVQNLPGEAKAEALMKVVVTKTAEKLAPCTQPATADPDTLRA
jgi:hypothetical protein